MAKRKRKKGQKPASTQEDPKPAPAAAAMPEPEEDDGITARGWKIIGAGIVTVAMGFYVLSLADSMGRNWAAHLSPFLILGGYVIIGLGIMAPESRKTSDDPSDLDSPTVA